MFPLPISIYIYAICGVLAVAGLGYGKYESAKYDAYVSKAELAAKEQEMINESKAKEATLVNEKVKNDYENRIALIKHTYGGMRLSSTSQTGTISATPNGTDGTPTDPQFIEKCAITTQMLESLQGWIKEQIGIFNDKK